MRELVRRYRVATFLLVTFTFTWGMWLGLASVGRRVAIGLEPLYLLGLLGPLVGALVTTGLTSGRAGLRELGGRMLRVRIGLRWWLVALGIPLAVYVACYALLAADSVVLLAPVELPTPGQLGGFPITNAAVLLAWIFVIDGFGEETGWRGFLLPIFQRAHSPVVASLLVAACWAAWHAPLFVIADGYAAMPAAMIPMFVIALACGSIVLTWLYNRGRGSIPLVAGFHAMLNLFSGAHGIAAVESAAVIVLAVTLVMHRPRVILPSCGSPSSS